MARLEDALRRLLSTPAGLQAQKELQADELAERGQKHGDLVERLRRVIAAAESAQAKRAKGLAAAEAAVREARVAAESASQTHARLTREDRGERLARTREIELLRAEVREMCPFGDLVEAAIAELQATIPAVGSVRELGHLEFRVEAEFITFDGRLGGSLRSNASARRAYLAAVPLAIDRIRDLVFDTPTRQAVSERIAAIRADLPDPQALTESV